ncbi:uncharacterized protein [Prorops nasuta]|uniref:uncharacterized protein n=1 Tax=Prorops nasuta TaxID=863751 RepID=UPI0034CDEF55
MLKLQLLNINEKCRICLAESDCMINLFDALLETKVNDLSKCSGISIKDEEGLPKLICHICLFKLDLWKTFKEQFIKTNTILLKHLNIQDADTVPGTKFSKQEQVEKEFEDNEEMKKAKTDIPALIPLKLSNNEQDKEFTVNNVTALESKEYDNVDNSEINVSTKTKPLSAKRTKNTEKRIASTKRWVERKKALLAATGENVSDTESDEAQLSPVQKARAKTNAEKEAERQRKLTRTLKNLEADMSGKYAIRHDNDNVIIADTDSDGRVTRSRKTLSIDIVKNKHNGGAFVEKENTKPLTFRKSINEITSSDQIMPLLINSQIEVGDATYIVTSKIIQGSTEASIFPCSKPLENDTTAISNDENSQDKNTDIIDAVQLRRVHPKTSKDKNFIERCLNIEVEGSELEPLRIIQTRLANFVEKEVKQRILSSQRSPDSKRSRRKQPIDAQLKNIVERTIKKNLEQSMAKNVASDLREFSKPVSPAFVKTALKSAKFQPKVLLDRFDTSKNNDERAPSTFVRKRKIHPPLKYSDYTTPTLQFNSLEQQGNVQREKVTEHPFKIRKTQKQKLVGQTDDLSTVNLKTQSKKQESVHSILKESNISEDNKSCSKTNSEKYNCRSCNINFASRSEGEAHLQLHKTNRSVSRLNKNKMMRCRRCHEVVEARFVKVHMCKANRHINKCFACNSVFRTEKLLARHLTTHDQSEFSLEKITNLKKIENVSKPASSVDDTAKKRGLSEDKLDNEPMKLKQTYTCFVCDKIFTDEEILKDHLQKHCDEISEDEQSTNKDQYQCAICGDSLISEALLEAHVEKHLFDDDDDNPNLISINQEKEKEIAQSFKCLQCPLSFKSEMLLEMHVQEHEEEAAIAEWEKKGLKVYSFRCKKCEEYFETEEELYEHADTHNGNGHVCQLCEKPFSTLTDLQNHVASHL